MSTENKSIRGRRASGEAVKPEVREYIEKNWPGAHVQLDPNGDILFIDYWHPDLIVSKSIFKIQELREP